MEELALNYASALYGIIDPKRAEDYLFALREFSSLLKENPTFNRALCSYALSAEEKGRLLEKTLGGSSLPHLLDFGNVILSHHRMKYFGSIAEAFASLVNESSGVKEGIVYSASSLTKKQLSDLEEAFSAKLSCRVALKNKVDEMLLGGVKVALDGKVYDGSLRNRLLELQKNLKKE